MTDEEVQSVKYGLLNVKLLLEKASHHAITYFGECCPYCGKNLFSGTIRNSYEIDHFIPIAKGGQDFPWNILPVCTECNRKKKDKWPWEFLDEAVFTKCDNYLKSVLVKLTNSHDDSLQIASLIKDLTERHAADKINDAELINTLYRVFGFQIKEQVAKSKDLGQYEHIHHFWKALSLEHRPSHLGNEKYYIKDSITNRLYVSLPKCHPLYVAYCKKNKITSEDIAFLRNLFAKTNYKPFIKSTQAGRGFSWTKAGFGCCYCFQYEQVKEDVNTIKIGDVQITL